MFKSRLVHYGDITIQCFYFLLKQQCVFLRAYLLIGISTKYQYRIFALYNLFCFINRAAFKIHYIAVSRQVIILFKSQEHFILRFGLIDELRRP